MANHHYQHQQQQQHLRSSYPRQNRSGYPVTIPTASHPRHAAQGPPYPSSASDAAVEEAAASTIPAGPRRGSLAESTEGGEIDKAVNGSSAAPTLGCTQQQAHNAPAGLASKPIRRRMRMITSCLECRRRKLKCNKSQPCSNCIKFSRDCLYIGPKLDEASQLRLTEIKEKVGSLERQLERDVAQSTGRGRGREAGHANGIQRGTVADDVEDEFCDSLDPDISSMVADDVTYDDDDGMGTDDLIDLGVLVGRMRITERIGGLNRPRISEEV